MLLREVEVSPTHKGQGKDRALCKCVVCTDVLLTKMWDQIAQSISTARQASNITKSELGWLQIKNKAAITRGIFLVKNAFSIDSL